MPECGRKHYGRGWCQPHWLRWRRHGDPLGGGSPVFDDPVKAFEARVVRGDPDECWIWQGCKDPKSGHGQMRINDRSVGAHRFSYELSNGIIPAGALVDHKCRNTSCVNPAHLRLADKSQNGQNRQGATVLSKSGVLGVHYDADRCKWVAQVHRKGVRWQRRFGTMAEAEAAVWAKRNELFTHNDLDREKQFDQVPESTGLRSDNKSGIRGVSWSEGRQKWVARVTYRGVHWTRRFDTLPEAEAAVIAKRNELFTHNDQDRVDA